MIESHARPIRSERVLAQQSGDNLVLLSPDTGLYFTLDDVGARVWHLCDGTRAIDEVVAEIHAEFDAPIDTIRVDVVELVEDLAKEHLVAAG